jgi:peptidoglycan/LPS O-acetylase OafA/YrhL
MANRNRFTTLDALRGAAAIGIILYHSNPDSPLAVPGGYLAVDLFFVLSGFVIALNYEDRLRKGMEVREFLALRAIRLWPMLLVGALLGIALYGGHAGMIFLLPYPYAEGLYPSNPPLWSLLFEAVAYFGFAIIIHRLPNSGLAALLIVSGLALAGFVHFGDKPLFELGAFWNSVPAGLARLSVSFTAGMLICRLRRGQGLHHRASHYAWLLPAALLGVLLFARGETYGLAAIFLFFPALVWFATKWDLPFPRLGNTLGALSYPLYCIHMPILALTAPPRPIVWLALIVASLLLDRYLDRPMRGWLIKLLKPSASQTRIGIST